MLGDSLAGRLYYHYSLSIMSSSNSAATTIDFQLYRYVPSLAAAILFVVLFVLITAYHLYQVVRMRSWYMLVFVTGGICKYY